MSRFYDGQPVVCVRPPEWWQSKGFDPAIVIPVLGERYVVVRSEKNPLAASRTDVELRERVPWHLYDESGFEPLTENTVRALEAIATDVPDEVRVGLGLERETQTQDA